MGLDPSALLKIKKKRFFIFSKTLSDIGYLACTDPIEFLHYFGFYSYSGFLKILIVLREKNAIRIFIEVYFTDMHFTYIRNYLIVLKYYSAIT